MVSWQSAHSWFLGAYMPLQHTNAMIALRLIHNVEPIHPQGLLLTPATFAMVINNRNVYTLYGQWFPFNYRSNTDTIFA